MDACPRSSSRSTTRVSPATCRPSALAQRYGFRIIEDASHAIGGRYKGEPIGNGRYSDITVFSFHPVKIITTAEGGMALTNNDDLATRLGLFRSHGITRDPALMSQPMDGPWYYEQVALGYNYRLTDLQAALGVSQMQRLDQYVDRRHEGRGATRNCWMGSR
jgi:dTDP-4-amino-4,6-dideoxygalactose transaminase